MESSRGNSSAQAHKISAGLSQQRSQPHCSGKSGGNTLHFPLRTYVIVAACHPLLEIFEINTDDCILTAMSASQNATANSGTLLLGFVAVLVGLTATYFVRQQWATPAAPMSAPSPAPPAAKITIPLASRDLPAGTTITLDDVALYRMTRQEIEEKITTRSFMANPSQIIGKVLVEDLVRGKTFTTENFYPTGQRPGIVERLSPGLRAVTVVLEPTDALQGFAGPGQRVDVLFHLGESTQAGGSPGSEGPLFSHHDFNPPGRRDYYGNRTGGGAASLVGELGLESATTTLVQDVEILALEDRALPTRAATSMGTDPISVTLAVSPRQAELIRVAQGHGRLSFTLRGPDDQAWVPLSDPVTLDEIIDVEDQSHHMEIYRGQAVTRLQFHEGKMVRRQTFPDPHAGADPVASTSPTPDVSGRRSAGPQDDTSAPPRHRSQQASQPRGPQLQEAFPYSAADRGVSSP